MPSSPMSKDDRYLTYLSLLFAGAAMLAYPATAVTAGALVLVFAAPMALATTGKLRRSRGWQSVAAIAGVAMLAASVTGIWIVVEFGLLLGAPLALVAVGLMIARHDRLAAIVWVAGSAVAFAIGVALVMLETGTVGMTPALVAIATIFAALRIARGQRALT